jgi:hypothetical protein
MRWEEYRSILQQDRCEWERLPKRFVSDYGELKSQRRQMERQCEESSLRNGAEVGVGNSFQVDI